MLFGVKYLIEPNNKRRDRISIIAKILGVAQKRALKTQIMYKANLNHHQTNAYIDFLLKGSFIAHSIIDDKEGYVATAKGRYFFKRYQELLGMMDSSSPIRKRKKPGSPEEPSSAQSPEATQ